MNRLSLLLLGLTLALSGCPLDEGSGGGNITEVDFTKGYVFVRKEDRNLYVSDQGDFEKAARLTQSGNVYQPSLSWDGNQIVYVESLGNEGRLMTVPASGGTPSVLLSSSQDFKGFRSPVFSPDGKTVVFAYTTGIASAIGQVNSDGSSVKKLAQNASLSYASPSFDASGKFVYVAAGNALALLTQVERIDVATGQATNVTNNLGTEAVYVANRLVASPDGLHLAFDGRLSSGTGATRIFVMELSSKAVTRLTEHLEEPDASDTFPSWVGNTKVGFSSNAGSQDFVYEIGLSEANTAGTAQLAVAIEPWFGPN